MDIPLLSISTPLLSLSPHRDWLYPNPASGQPIVSLDAYVEPLVLLWMIAVRSWTERGEGKTIYSWP